MSTAGDHGDAIADDPRLADPALRALLLGDDAGAADIGGMTDRGRRRFLFWRRATGGLAAPDRAIERRLAADILALMDEQPPATVLRARAPMLARAASAVRAAHEEALAIGPHDGAVKVTATEHPWRGFFGIEVLHLRHRHQDGSMSPPLRREICVSTDAVTVLPYDPERDAVLVTEQFRPAPLVRGSAATWVTEPIAGRIDAGETPEEAARREAAEEAGLALASLILVARYYPSPGALSEHVHSFVAISPLTEGGIHGRKEEGEDIRTRVWPFERAMKEMEAGRVMNGPLVLTLFWLQARRHDLARAR